MDFTDISGTFTVILSVIVTIIVSVVANLFTRPVQRWLDRFVTTTRGKTLSRLKREYARIKLWHDNPSLVTIHIGILLTITISLVLILTLIVIGISIVNLNSIMSFSVEGRNIPHTFQYFQSILLYMSIGFALIGGVILFAFIRLSAFLGDIYRLRNFDRYEKSFQERIAFLEREASAKTVEN